MNAAKELKILGVLIVVFVLSFFLPVESERFTNAILDSLKLIKWYAREHVLLCLVPAFFIAGAIGVFVSSASVMKYLGAGANKVLAYSVAAVSGTILAVCSCTILPLFAGIYRMGAGIGPATTFLYAGPAINVLAIILTARVLGVEMGIARAVCAIGFSVVIGLIMHMIYRNDEHEKISAAMVSNDEDDGSRPLWLNALFFALMVAVLVFANWGRPSDESGVIWRTLFAWKWYITGASAFALGILMVKMFKFAIWKMAALAIPTAALGFMFPQYPMIPFVFGFSGLTIIMVTSDGEPNDWLSATWTFAKQILPLLFFGVIVAGVLLGAKGVEGGVGEGIIPNSWVSSLVGGNSLFANLFASIFGAFMYFATLTEVPILEGLMGSGMGKGPALALLLAGPALSLPNMLVIRSVIGTKKTIVFVSLVVVMATISGILYGTFFG